MPAYEVVDVKELINTWNRNYIYYQPDMMEDQKQKNSFANEFVDSLELDEKSQKKIPDALAKVCKSDSVVIKDRISPFEGYEQHRHLNQQIAQAKQYSHPQITYKVDSLGNDGNVLLYPKQAEGVQHILQAKLQVIAKENIDWDSIVVMIIKQVQNVLKSAFGKELKINSNQLGKSVILNEPNPDNILDEQIESNLQQDDELDDGLEELDVTKMKDIRYETICGLIDDIQYEIINVLAKELHQKLALNFTQSQKGLIYQLALQVCWIE